jgi:hypothetical protein
MNSRLLAVVLMLSLTAVGLGATVFREQVAAAAPGIQDVFVTNSTREPVPVHEQGTADVNVANQSLGVHEQGTANVNVTNAPLAVRMSGEQPVQRTLEWGFGGGCFATDTYAVPSGKYLRIEQVTFLQAKTQDYIASFAVQTDFTKHFLEHTKNGVSQLVRVYGSPGSTVGFPVVMDQPICGGTWQGSFSGVLIDAP